MSWFCSDAGVSPAIPLTIYLMQIVEAELEFLTEFQGSLATAVQMKGPVRKRAAF